MSTQTATMENLFYQSRFFAPAAKVVHLLTNPVGFNDASHIIAYGHTVGGSLHRSRRSANWNELSNNVYNQACYSRNLNAYRAEGTNMVVVLGNQYMTIYHSGEYQRKLIHYSSIERISYVDNEIRLWIRAQGEGYSYVAIKDVQEGYNQLIARLMYHMNKSGQLANNVSCSVTRSDATVPKAICNPYMTASVLGIVWMIALAGVFMLMLFSMG